MIEILYCNEDNIITSLAESLVIGGLPMRKETTFDNLSYEISDLTYFLDNVWSYKEDFIFDKTEKKIRIREDLLDEDDLEHLNFLSFILSSVEDDYEDLEECIENINNSLDEELNNPYIKRGINLGHVPTGSGHNSMFKGVGFNMIIKFPLYWLKEYQRYNFTDIISSQSTMHKILEFDLSKMFSDKVDKRCIAVIEELRDKYNNEKDKDKKKEIWEAIINSCPDGLHMVMGITMNYLQAVSIIKQREHHKLSEWSKDFVPYLKSLPYLDFFLLEDKDNK